MHDYQHSLFFWQLPVISLNTIYATSAALNIMLMSPNLVGQSALHATRYLSLFTGRKLKAAELAATNNTDYCHKYMLLGLQNKLLAEEK